MGNIDSIKYRLAMASNTVIVNQIPTDIQIGSSFIIDLQLADSMNNKLQDTSEVDIIVKGDPFDVPFKIIQKYSPNGVQLEFTPEVIGTTTLMIFVDGFQIPRNFTFYVNPGNSLLRFI